MEESQLIPKTVHYIWFGNNPKSELIEKCIASWKRFLPGWQFIEWNESNYDVNKAAYIKEAYAAKKYAFAADYARFDILYHHGGLYFDTDVELLKPIPETFLKAEGFAAVESNKRIAPGLVFAAKPGNSIVNEIMDIYNNEHFIVEGKPNEHTVVQYTTEVFAGHGFKMNGAKQIIDGFVIYPMEYFCAYDFDVHEFNITKETISIHHYTYAWGSGTQKLFKKIKVYIKNIVGVENYRKLLKIKRKFFGVRGE